MDDKFCPVKSPRADRPHKDQLIGPGSLKALADTKRGGLVAKVYRPMRTAAQRQRNGL